MTTLKEIIKHMEKVGGHLEGKGDGSVKWEDNGEGQESPKGNDGSRLFTSPAITPVPHSKEEK